MIIGVDFDGTIVDHVYPDIGAPVPGAIHWMKEWLKAGAKIILWTMRSDTERHGPTLTAAVKFCEDNGIKFYGINENPTQKSWTTSNKQHCNLYVDDAAFGCPLRENPRLGGRPYVDWDVVGPGVLKIIKDRANG